MTPVSVFISYSREDAREKDQLCEQLVVLERANKICVWCDDAIHAGTRWEPEIEEAISKARIAILLITRNFLASSYIAAKEVPCLLARYEANQVALVPIIARPCAWKHADWLAELQVWPRSDTVWRSGRSADAALTEIVDEVAKLAQEIAQQQAADSAGNRTDPVPDTQGPPPPGAAAGQPEPAPASPVAPDPTPTRPRRSQRPRSTEARPAVETVLIPAGPFWMGCPRDDPEAFENEKPCRRIELPAYRIGKYPVTNLDYYQFVVATHHRSPGHWKGQLPKELTDHPVVNVSYAEAQAYCEWLSRVTGTQYRLPTEQEWEKAARGTDERRYPWGKEWHPDRCNSLEAEHASTTPVRAYEPRGASPYGVLDLVGNVAEWTASWYDAYPGTPSQSPFFGEIQRVVRGGAWMHSAQWTRVTFRGHYRPETRRDVLGFRIVTDEI
jgi:formylglycine-generating enzyme required for sulfatase activity